MKKFLLLAALAAIAIGASAEGYMIEKVWELNPNTIFGVTTDVRQGFGMNGKFYINDKATQTIYVIDQRYGENVGDVDDDGEIAIGDVSALIDYLLTSDASLIALENADMDVDGEVAINDVAALIDYLLSGKKGPTLSGGTNCAITRDEAGNLIVGMGGFAANAAGSAIKVINPETGETKTYTIPEECGFQGRCDFFGFAKGDMMDEGVLYLTGGNNTDAIKTEGVAIFAVSGGEVDFDECRLAAVDGGIVGQSSTVINYYVDINGDDALMYAYRSGAPTKLLADGDLFAKTAIVLPGKGACNGIFPFVWDGMELFIYPLLPNYQNGFAIAQAGAETAIVEVPSFINGNQNGFQCNWLNAEVDEDGVNVYQYAPGGNITLWRLTKE